MSIDRERALRVARARVYRALHPVEVEIVDAVLALDKPEHEPTRDELIRDVLISEELSDLRVENEQLRNRAQENYDRATAAMNREGEYQLRAERAEAEVEHLKQQNASWEKIAAELEDEVAERRSLHITDEVVERALVAFDGTAKIGDRIVGESAMRVALEAVWPTPAEPDITGWMVSNAIRAYEQAREAGESDWNCMCAALAEVRGRAERAEAEVERWRQWLSPVEPAVHARGSAVASSSNENLDKCDCCHGECFSSDCIGCTCAASKHEPVWDDPDVIDVVADALWEQNCERNHLSPQPRPDSWGLNDALTIVRRAAFASKEEGRQP